MQVEDIQKDYNYDSAANHCPNRDDKSDSQTLLRELHSCCRCKAVFYRRYDYIIISLLTFRIEEVLFTLLLQGDAGFQDS